MHSIESLLRNVLIATALIGSVNGNAQTPTLNAQVPLKVAPAMKVPTIAVTTEVPGVTMTSPANFAIAGDKLTFYGNLAAPDFHATFGTPPVPLPVVSFGPVARPATNIVVTIPANIATGTGPLVVWYGTHSTKSTLKTNFKIVKPPSVIALRTLSPPQLSFDSSSHRSTLIEVDLNDFDPTIGNSFARPSLWTTDCIPNGTTRVGVIAKSETNGSPYHVRFDYSFSGIELSGRHCHMQIKPYETSFEIQAGEVVLPAYSTYTINNTWDLTMLTTASGTKLVPSGHNGQVLCQLASIGKQGSFATGVVNDGGDLSFQLRNGLFQENCEFLTSIPLQVKDGWIVKNVNWQFTRDTNCDATEFGFQLPSNQPVSALSDSTAVFAVKFQATCRPDASDLTNNRHLYKAKLDSVVLYGPAGQDWHNAFK